MYATTADLARLPYDGLAEGFYLVGSGNTGVALSLASIGNRRGLPSGVREYWCTTQSSFYR